MHVNDRLVGVGVPGSGGAKFRLLTIIAQIAIVLERCATTFAPTSLETFALGPLPRAGEAVSSTTGLGLLVMAPPLASMIVPSFNQGRFIGETIRSCLEQDYRPVEVLVIDGGSTDQTADVVSSFNHPALRFVSEPDAGVADAVNKGLRMARGAILTIQSSDDVFVPGAVAAAAAAFATQPELGLVYGDVELVDGESRVIGADIQGPFDLARYLGRLMYVPQPGAFFARRVLESVGGWREEFSYAADADFWVRIALRFPVKKLGRLMARYRYHDAQRDRQRASIARDWEGMIRDAMTRTELQGELRRRARSGICLARHRYADSDQWWLRTRSLYQALLINPGLLREPAFPKRDLLPGRDPIWRQLSRTKRWLGIPPRGRSGRKEHTAE